MRKPPKTPDIRLFKWMTGASLFVCLVAVVVLAALAGWHDMVAAIRHLHQPLMQALPVIVLAVIFNMFVRGGRWPLMAKNLGLQVPLPRLVAIYVSGYAFVPTPGKAGTAIRLWLLQKNHRIAYSRSAPLMVIDQLSDLLALSFLSVFGFGALAGHGFSLTITVLFLGGLAAVLMWPAFGVYALKGLYGLLGKKKPRIFVKLKRLVRFFAQTASPKLLLANVCLAMMGWLSMGCAFWWLLGLAGVPLPLFAVVGVYAFASVVGALSMMPGGLGSTEAVMVALLLPLGVPAAIAVPAVLVVRGCVVWLPVAVGFVVLPFTLKQTHTPR